MKRVGGVMKGYGISLCFAGAIVLGYDSHKTSKWTYVEQTWEIAEDLTLALVWPITGPLAVKRAVEGMEFGPFFDNKNKKN